MSEPNGIVFLQYIYIKPQSLENFALLFVFNCQSNVSLEIFFTIKADIARSQVE